MEYKLANRFGSLIVISSTEWPGKFMMSTRSSDGSMHVMFIKDAEKEIRMLKGEGYVEVDG